MPIFVEKATDVPTDKQIPTEKMTKPWITDIDYQTGDITWSTSEMNKLKAAIVSCVNKNDAVLLANQKEMKAAIKAGYIRINVDSDGMPNWHDIRMVVYLYTTAPTLKEIIFRCPGEVLRQAILELDQQDKFKRVEPTRVY